MARAGGRIRKLEQRVQPVPQMGGNKPKPAAHLMGWRASVSLLPTAEYEVFEARQLLSTHRATGVHFAGRDADFRAHAKLASIGKLGRGVVHDHG